MTIKFLTPIRSRILNPAFPAVRRGILVSTRAYSGGFATTPAPPRLPKEEQEEFEKLQHIANTQGIIQEFNSQIETGEEKSPEDIAAPILAKTDIGGFHPDYIGTIPEFEGDVNPKTGEIGGPKQDPLRHGDYSFNGRVTDF